MPEAKDKNGTPSIPFHIQTPTGLITAWISPSNTDCATKSQERGARKGCWREPNRGGDFLKQVFVKILGLQKRRSTSEESVRYAHQTFKVRDSDVFNLTYPKSGTTWMQEILTLIHSDGDTTLSRSVPSWERVPWLEQNTAATYLEDRPCPRLISSHLPPSIFPESFFTSQAKAIYTVRDPRDVCVSLYYYAKMSSFLDYKEDFGEFLEMFSSGKILFGTWFDHVKSWLTYKDRTNFLLLTYDELLKDLQGSVLRICRFLGKDLDASAVDSVVENASFESMKGNKMVNYSLVPDDVMNHSISPFLRKGISGDWRNHFTSEQTASFQRLYQEKMKDVEIKFPWD